MSNRYFCGVLMHGLLTPTLTVYFHGRERHGMERKRSSLPCMKIGKIGSAICRETLPCCPASNDRIFEVSHHSVHFEVSIAVV